MRRCEMERKMNGRRKPQRAQGAAREDADLEIQIPMQ